MLYTLNHIWFRSQGYLYIQCPICRCPLSRSLSLQSSCSKLGISIHPTSLPSIHPSHHRGHTAKKFQIPHHRDRCRERRQHRSPSLASSLANTTAAPTSPAPATSSSTLHRRSHIQVMLSKGIELPVLLRTPLRRINRIDHITVLHASNSILLQCLLRA